MAGPSGHRFSNLIGSGDNVTTDAGHLRVTFHHNWWADNVDQRMPRTRFGNIHVFNNLFTSTGNSYCTNAGIQAHVLVENNVYIGVNQPLSPDANGDMLARGNVFTSTSRRTRPPTEPASRLPYTYTLDATARSRSDDSSASRAALSSPLYSPHLKPGSARVCVGKPSTAMASEISPQRTVTCMAPRGVLACWNGRLPAAGWPSISHAQPGVA